MIESSVPPSWDLVPSIDLSDDPTSNEDDSNHEPWDLTPAVDLFDRLIVSNEDDSDHEPSYFDYISKNDQSITSRCTSNTLGDFTKIWNYLNNNASTHCQEIDEGDYESASPSFSSGDVFSGPDSLPDSLPSPVIDNSDTPDIFETYVRKSKEARWKSEVRGTKFPKQTQRRQSIRDLENDSEHPTLLSGTELNKPIAGQVLPQKKLASSPLATDRLFEIQSPSLQRSRRTLQQKFYSNSQTDESSGLESGIETPSRLKSTNSLARVPIGYIDNDLISGAKHLLYNSIFEEQRKAIVRKLLRRSSVDKYTLLKPPTFSQRSTDPEAIHIFVDYSNIIIGFNQALRRAIPEEVQMKIPLFSYRSLSFILERNRPVARRILSGSKQPHISKLPGHFIEAQRYGYETNIMDRVWKDRELAPKKMLRGRGNGYLNGQSSESDTPSSNKLIKAQCEQGVDEILHLKLLETLCDFNKPSTIVLATGDGAEAEYSGGFFKNVERALEKDWKVELVAWKYGLSHEYRSKSFRQRWGKQFSILLLDNFCEELLGIWAEQEVPAGNLLM
ncbi:hypothetical protein EYC80_007753 [Monilinia laxa]|nr:hypothetical protein EYC80_007753 [Monilinia laxa]